MFGIVHITKRMYAQVRCYKVGNIIKRKADVRGTLG